MVLFLAGAAVTILGSLAKTTVEGLAPEFLAKGRVQLAKQSFRRKLAVYKMNMEQQKLFREDIRDLVELSVGRMDIYHLVGALLLGVSITLYTKNPFLRVDESAEEAPFWAVSLFLISNMSATGYLVLGTWFSMHASVASHSIGVRLLTRFARLSIPGKAELDRVTQVHMLPLLDSPEPESAGALDEGLEAMEDREYHLRRYRREQQQWLSYDAHARVCMSLGILQVIQALCYYLIGRATGHRVTVPSLVGLQALAFTLQRLDERTESTAEQVVALLLGQLAPVLVGFLAWLSRGGAAMKWILAFAFILHSFSVLFSAQRFALFAEGGLSQLPRRLRTVFYLDVVGAPSHGVGGGRLPPRVDVVGVPSHGGGGARSLSSATHRLDEAGAPSYGEGGGRLPSAATPLEELPRVLVRRFACVLALLWMLAAAELFLHSSGARVQAAPQFATSMVNAFRCSGSVGPGRAAQFAANVSFLDLRSAAAAAPHAWDVVAATVCAEEVVLAGWDGVRVVVARAVQASRWSIVPRYAVGRGEHFQNVVAMEFGPEGHTLAVLHAGGSKLDSWDLVHGARVGRWDLGVQGQGVASCHEGRVLPGPAGNGGAELEPTVAAMGLRLAEGKHWW